MRVRTHSSKGHTRGPPPSSYRAVGLTRFRLPRNPVNIHEREAHEAYSRRGYVDLPAYVYT